VPGGHETRTLADALTPCPPTLAVALYSYVSGACSVTLRLALHTLPASVHQSAYPSIVIVVRSRTGSKEAKSENACPTVALAGPESVNCTESHAPSSFASAQHASFTHASPAAQSFLSRHATHAAAEPASKQNGVGATQVVVSCQLVHAPP